MAISSPVADASKVQSCLAARTLSRRWFRLSEMFGYATELRSRTQGRGAFTMHFGQYEEVPRSIAEEIVSKAQGKVVG